MAFLDQAKQQLEPAFSSNPAGRKRQGLGRSMLITRDRVKKKKKLPADECVAHSSQPSLPPSFPPTHVPAPRPPSFPLWGETEFHWGETESLLSLSLSLSLSLGSDYSLSLLGGGHSLSLFLHLCTSLLHRNDPNCCLSLGSMPVASCSPQPR